MYSKGELRALRLRMGSGDSKLFLEKYRDFTYSVGQFQTRCDLHYQKFLPLAPVLCSAALAHGQTEKINQIYNSCLNVISLLDSDFKAEPPRVPPQLNPREQGFHLLMFRLLRYKVVANAYDRGCDHSARGNILGLRENLSYYDDTNLISGESGHREPFRDSSIRVRLQLDIYSDAVRAFFFYWLKDHAPSHLSNWGGAGGVKKICQEFLEIHSSVNLNDHRDLTREIHKDSFYRAQILLNCFNIEQIESTAKSAFADRYNLLTSDGSKSLTLALAHYETYNVALALSNRHGEALSNLSKSFDIVRSTELEHPRKNVLRIMEWVREKRRLDGFN